MSANQCGFCASQLGSSVQLWGVSRVVCDDCLGFLMRWSIEGTKEHPKEVQPECLLALGKSLRYMSHDKTCACLGSDESDCDCGHTAAFDSVMKFVECHKASELPRKEGV